MERPELAMGWHQVEGVNVIDRTLIILANQAGFRKPAGELATDRPFPGFLTHNPEADLSALRSQLQDEFSPIRQTARQSTEEPGRPLRRESGPGCKGDSPGNDRLRRLPRPEGVQESED